MSTSNSQAIYGLVGAALGVIATLSVTHQNIAATKQGQILADRKLAVTQINGEKAQFIALTSLSRSTVDMAAAYQHFAFNTVDKSGNKEVSKVHELMWSDFQQQERNIEHYHQELVSLAQRLYESLALARLAFPPDPNLEALLQKAEAILTTPDSIFPMETGKDITAWTNSPNLAQVVKQRQAQQMRNIVQYLQPVNDLLDYLSPRVND